MATSAQVRAPFGDTTVALPSARAAGGTADTNFDPAGDARVLQAGHLDPVLKTGDEDRVNLELAELHGGVRDT